MRVPEEYRLKDHEVLGSNAGHGNNGFFIVPHPKITDYAYQVQASDGMGWEHVSISLIKKEKRNIKAVERCPTWGEMCWVKTLFWGDEEAVMQLHPPKSEWVNNHPYCLHLWRPREINIPLPESIMVGHKKLNVDAQM